MEVDFLSSIQARMGLETPQVVCTWEFSTDLLVPFWQGTEEDNPAHPSWVWNHIYVRRSDFRFPEDIAEGTSVLSEAVSAAPTTSIGDVTVDGMNEYYYSIFLKYVEASTSSVLLDQPVDRIGAAFTACKPYDLAYPDAFFPIVSGVDGTANGGTHLFGSVGSTFLTSGVQAGFIVYVAGHDVYARIEQVVSETSLYLGTGFTITDTGLTFYIVSHHYKYLLAGEDFNRYQCVYRYDSTTQLVEQKMLFNDVLDVNEHIVDVAFCGYYYSHTDIGPFICIVTEHRFLRFLYDPTARLVAFTALDVEGEWTFDGITEGYVIAGAFVEPQILTASERVYVLDAAHRTIWILREAHATEGTVLGSIDLTGIPDSVDALHGLSIMFTGSSSITVGCHSWIVQFAFAETAVDPTNVERVIYTRRELDCSFGVHRLIPATVAASTEHMVGVLHTHDLLSYLAESCSFLWQQPATPDQNTIGLYHIHDGIVGGTTITDSSGNGNDGTVVGTLTVGEGKFYQSVVSPIALGAIDISAVAAMFDGDEGTISAWLAIDDALDFDDAVNERVLINLVSASDALSVSFLNGNILYKHSNGGVGTITVAHPSKDLAHHHYMISWSVTGNYVHAYFDGVLVGTDTLGGAWAGVLTTARIGDDAFLSGRMSEIVLLDQARDVPWGSASELPFLITPPNKMYAFSGRDYNAY